MPLIKPHPAIQLKYILKISEEFQYDMVIRRPLHLRKKSKYCSPPQLIDLGEKIMEKNEEQLK